MATLRRVRTVFLGVPGTPWYSNMYFDGSGSTTDQQVDAVRDFWTALAGVMDNAVGMTIEGDCARIDDATGQVIGIDSTAALTVSGGSASQALPVATQGILNTFTSVFVGGRQLRGKVFIPGLIITQADTAGAPAAGFKSTLLTAGNALMTAADAFGNWKVWSRRNGVSSDITAVSTPSIFGVLRSRRD